MSGWSSDEEEANKAYAVATFTKSSEESGNERGFRSESSREFVRNDRGNRRGNYNNERRGRGSYNNERGARGSYNNEGRGRGNYNNEGRGRGNYNNEGRGRGNYNNEGRGRRNYNSEEQGRENFYSGGDRRQNFSGERQNFNRERGNFNQGRERQDNYGERKPFQQNGSESSSDSRYETSEQSKPQVEPGFNWLAFVKESEKHVEAEWAKLPPIIKQFYKEHPEITALTEEEVALIRESNMNIVVDRTFKTEESKPVPKPIIRFEHAFHNFPEILDVIAQAGFEKPSPIQCQAWPVLLSGEDLIGIAQTGTGKTLAFLLPAMIHIDGQNTPREERGGPAVLVMAPTRELALQIDKEIKKYSYKGITSVCVYGGGDRKRQISDVTDGVDIVIATPGRMNDLADAGHLNVKTVSYVVLDEADRMLDMGFEPQIRKVMYALRPNRQCVMTSATWPPGVRRLASSYMCDPIQVYVGTLDLAATHTVTQVIQLVEEDEKEELFFEFARNLGPDEKVIVFCGRKARADHLSVELSMHDIPCAALHGDRDQIDREQAVKDIGDGTVKILIATDVASRGLDIDDITHVLNFDFPRNIEEYVHRVGRTGRAGKSGEAISYFTRSDWGAAGELIKILEEAQQYIPEELYGMQERYEAMKERREREGGFGGRGRGRGGGRRQW